MTDEEHIRAFVTEYALTEGILEVCGHVPHDISDRMFVWRSHNGSELIAHGKDWHRTREEAVKRAEEMRLAKIKLLKRHIEKFEKMKF